MVRDFENYQIFLSNYNLDLRSFGQLFSLFSLVNAKMFQHFLKLSREKVIVFRNFQDVGRCDSNVFVSGRF